MADAELALSKQTRQGAKVERVLATRHTAMLSIPGTPPSYNVTAQAHWTKHRKVKREWQQHLETALMVERLPRDLLRLEATAYMIFRQRRRRDEGNFRVILEKALGDALVNGRWLEDDTADRYEFGQVTLYEEPGDAITVVNLTYYRREH